MQRPTVVTPYMKLCLSEKEYINAAKSCGMSLSHEWVINGCGATVHNETIDHKLYCIVCLNVPDWVTPIEIAAMLVHEATHIKQVLMQSIGESEPSKEFEAYTMQQICLGLFDEYARRTTKN
jgi:hypothetical protein